MNMRTCRTMLVGWMILSGVLVVLLASTMDYQTVLEQENDRLRKQLAPSGFQREIYQAVLCPSGNSFAQRIDKRRADGTIYKSNWRRQCV